MDERIFFTMEDYLKLANQPPTATVIVKQESKFKHWLIQLKEKTTFKDVYLWLSTILNIELLIALFRILALVA